MTPEDRAAREYWISLEGRAYLDQLIAEFESKARWCDAYGYAADAIEHRAYVRQLYRRIGGVRVPVPRPRRVPHAVQLCLDLQGAA